MIPAVTYGRIYQHRTDPAPPAFGVTRSLRPIRERATMSQSRHPQPDHQPSQDAGGVHAPDWVTDALIADTIQTWQPYYDTTLTEQDAIEMLVNVGRLTALLEADHDQEHIPRKNQL